MSDKLSVLLLLPWLCVPTELLVRHEGQDPRKRNALYVKESHVYMLKVMHICTQAHMKFP